MYEEPLSPQPPQPSAPTGDEKGLALLQALSWALLTCVPGFFLSVVGRWRLSASS